jgi:hypothetical protein
LNFCVNDEKVLQLSILNDKEEVLLRTLYANYKHLNLKIISFDVYNNNKLYIIEDHCFIAIIVKNVFTNVLLYGYILSKYTNYFYIVVKGYIVYERNIRKLFNKDEYKVLKFNTANEHFKIQINTKLFNQLVKSIVSTHKLLNVFNAVNLLMPEVPLVSADLIESLINPTLTLLDNTTIVDLCNVNLCNDLYFVRYVRAINYGVNDYVINSLVVDEPKLEEKNNALECKICFNNAIDILYLPCKNCNRVVFNGASDCETYYATYCVSYVLCEHHQLSFCQMPLVFS